MAKRKVRTTQPKPRPTPPNPMDRALMYAVNGLYFGVGAAALVADNAEGFVKKAVQRGQRVDFSESLGKLYDLQESLQQTVQANVGRLAELPRQPLKAIRSLVTSRRDRDPMIVLEARLREEVLKAASRVQTPLKKNIQDLTKKVNNLSNLVGKMAAAR